MTVWDGLKLVYRNLYTRKMRTLLTALGVAIGTAAIIGMISLAIGLKASAIQSFESFQDITLLDVRPSDDPSQNRMNNPVLTQKSVDELKNLPGVSGVMPFNRLWTDMEIRLGRKIGQGGLIGIDASDAAAFKFKLDQGEFVSGVKNEVVVTYPVPLSMREKQRRSRDNKDVQPMGFYGAQMGNQSNEPTDMLNKTITLSFKKYSNNGNIEQRDYRVKVVGILTEGEGEGGPALYLTMDLLNDIKKWLGHEITQGGQDRASRGEATYESVKIKVVNRQQVEQTVEDIRALGYQTWSPTENLKEINKFFSVLQLILGGIGAISLLVASIGIMNTMFMSILERTREIGIIKVLGASIPDIRKLFLVESGTIGLIGGIVGLGAGHAGAAIINLVAKHNTGGGPFGQMDKIAVIPIWLSLFAIGFAIFIGVIFGYLPANRAAKISPLQAIRHE